MGRALELPPDAGLPVELFGPRIADGTMHFSETMPPGPERERAIADMKAKLAVTAGKLDDLADRLREVVVQHDPAQLLASIAVPARMGFSDPSVADDAPATFTLDAKIEYLAGLALTAQPGTADVDQDVTGAVVHLVSQVFDAARARLFLDSSDEKQTARAGIDQTSYLVRLERLLDRMAGYAVHLETIDADIFDPHRAFYTDALGFCPSDCVRLVRRHNAWINREYNEAVAGLRDAFDDEQNKTLGEGATARFYGAMEASYLWTPALLAESTGLPEVELVALLAHVATEFGCQPDFRLPFDDNAARTRPLIRLSDATFLSPLSWSIAHTVHARLEEYVRSTHDDKFGAAYMKHRSDGAERLVAQAMVTVFGRDAVRANQHYDGTEGHGEIDCLVAGGKPLLAEVKSHSLTDLGRRGHRSRLDRVADDVVTKSFDQARRASEYIGGGGREFARKEGDEQVTLLPPNVGAPIELVVTFERMDPVTLSASELAQNASPRAVWVTNLADLLMVRDVLPDPAEFLHYAATRSVAAEIRLQIYMESDALNGYLIDRLAPILARSETSEDDRLVSLGYSSSDINSYFTGREVGLEVEGLSTGVPEPIRDALRSCVDQYSLDWWIVVKEVMSVDAAGWRRWRHFARKHKTERSFILPGGASAVAVSPAVSAPELRTTPLPTLIIPRRDLA